MPAPPRTHGLLILTEQMLLAETTPCRDKDGVSFRLAVTLTPYPIPELDLGNLVKVDLVAPGEKLKLTTTRFFLKKQKSENRLRSPGKSSFGGYLGYRPFSTI